MNDTLTADIAKFVQNVVSAMGADLTAGVEETPEATRINLDGEDGGVLIRRGGEGLQALQHLVATAFRRHSACCNSVWRRLSDFLASLPPADALRITTPKMNRASGCRASAGALNGGMNVTSGFASS